jgi:ribosomal protein S18 acetylase RimI-like enzyme
MHDIAIVQVKRAEVPQLHAALAHLSEGMGDTHRATEADLIEHGFGPDPAFRALLATSADITAGALVCAPVFSTVFGGPGLYVSDLWVAPEARGRNIGPRLLAHAARLWPPRYLRLAVYDDNPDARRFYDRLGFEPGTGETAMLLHGPALARLKGET